MVALYALQLILFLSAAAFSANVCDFPTYTDQKALRKAERRCRAKGKDQMSSEEVATWARLLINIDNQKHRGELLDLTYFACSKMLEESKFDKAIETFKAVLDFPGPHRIDTYMGISNINIKIDRIDEARKNLRQAISAQAATGGTVSTALRLQLAIAMPLSYNTMKQQVHERQRYAKELHRLSKRTDLFITTPYEKCRFPYSPGLALIGRLGYNDAPLVIGKPDDPMLDIIFVNSSEVDVVRSMALTDFFLWKT